MRNIRTIIKTEYEKTLSENKKAGKFSASHGAGKLLLLFFLFMLIFTFVSRAFASISVARVTVSNPQRDRLIYSVEGNGEIIPEKDTRLTVLPGYRIDEVFVKAGEEVDSGTALYAYSMEALQDKYTSIENEIKKIELLISQERIRQQGLEGKPSASAILSLKQARENLEAAKVKLEEAQKDYEDSLDSSKEKLLEAKEKEYDEAMKRYETLIYSQEKQLKLSQRAVEDANTAFEQAGETKANLELLIDRYKDAVLHKDRFDIYLAQKDILEAYHGGAEAYEQHEEEIYTKASAVMGEVYNLMNMQNNFLLYEERLYTVKDELQKLLSSTDPSNHSEYNEKALKDRYESTMDAYFSYLEEYERQLNRMEDAYGKESVELKRLRRNDKQVKDYLKQLDQSMKDGVDSEAQEKKLFDYLYKDQQKETEQEIKNKTLTLTRAKEDYDLLEKEFEIARKALQPENAQLKNDIQSIEAGTYDYEEVLEGKRQAVEAASEAVRIAKQTVELRNMEEAATGDQGSRQISELTIQSHTIDLTVKEQELSEVSALMESSGEVRSPMEGVVTFVGVEAGRTTTGEEQISLGYGDYIFRAVLDREAGANLSEGDSASITRAGKRMGIDVEVERIAFTEDGSSEITATMPEEEYIFGEKTRFKIMTQSEQYDLCIPMQALREDNYGYYVLVTSEQEDILGTVLIADRINVTILDKGSRTVAVDGPISPKSQVITDSNKYINAGDRIRIDD